MDTRGILTLFEKIYGSSGGAESFFAPGRVNLIGEHTDYNGGHVLPCALTFGTYIAARKRTDGTVRCFSENFPESGVVFFELDEIAPEPRHGWANYPKGVVKAFRENGLPIGSGFDMVVRGDMPSGAGLSSSASIEMATAVMLSSLFSLGLEDEAGRVRMALLGKEVENRFIGVNSGIMDQFAVALGRAGTALFLDCATLERRYVPLELGKYEIVVMNTNKSRALVESRYNERRSECDRALADLQKSGVTIRSLGDLSVEEFEQAADAIHDPVCRRRARHAVFENARVLTAVAALESGRIAEFGGLLNESHVSLQFDYETTGRELDCLAELSWQSGECLGARMTGAGFGGSALAIVRSDGVDAFTRFVGERYRRYIGYDCSFFRSVAGDGARRI